jgi:hypothetical protein
LFYLLPLQFSTSIFIKSQETLINQPSIIKLLSEAEAAAAIISTTLSEEQQNTSGLSKLLRFYLWKCKLGQNSLVQTWSNAGLNMLIVLELVNTFSVCHTPKLYCTAME